MSARVALPLAVALLVAASVVQASIHATTNKPARTRHRLDVHGRLAGRLWPGGSQPVSVSLSNRMRSTVWITSLRVGVVVDDAHAAGCSGARDFAVAQLPASSYPIKLPALSIFRPGWPAHLRWPATRRWSLRALGVTALPTVSMVDLPQVNQDDCKGARLRLVFRARAYLPPGTRGPQ